MANNPLVIWRLTDGKAGHEKQTQGLCQALSRLTPCAVHDLRSPSGWRGFLDWLTGRFSQRRSLPSPDLIIGAGHKTHWALLAARRAHGGKTVVCMRPSLPLRWFDLCLIPKHDHPATLDNVIETRGALTSVVPGGQHDPERGLILIGGPSAHFAWDSTAIAAQVADLLRAKPHIRWTLTTSRRTPGDFLGHLPESGFELHPAEQTPPGWLEAQLAEHGHAWVTPDSVSMIYEALTSGCRVGLFNLPARPKSRVATGVMELVRSGFITDGAHQLKHPISSQIFDESTRCAEAILKRWHLDLMAPK